MTVSSSPPGELLDSSDCDPGSQSGLLDAGAMLAVFLVAPRDDAQEVAAGIAQAGLVAIEALTVHELAAHRACRVFLVDTSIVSVAVVMEQLAGSRFHSWVIALVGDPSDECTALTSGAIAALRKPVSAPLVAMHLSRLREHASRADAQRDALELQATQARAESVQHLAAVITHEMAGPLGVVLVNTGILRDQLREDRLSGRPCWEDLDAITAEIERAVKRVHRNVAEMRALARSGAMPIARTSLAAAARSAITEISNPLRIPIALQIASEIHALASPELLRHVMDNLIANALHAVQGALHPQVTVRVYAQSGEARISVRDNGPGVPAHLRGRIFEPFFTTKGDQGMGVGLALCRELVARMGGALTLASSGPGACFRVRLRPA